MKNVYTYKCKKCGELFESIYELSPDICDECDIIDDKIKQDISDSHYDPENDDQE